MNKIEFKNLNHLYNDESYVINLNHKQNLIVCEEFIKDFFSFKEPPKKIKKLSIVKNPNGFFKLGINSDNVYWFVKDGKSFRKEYDDNSTYIGTELSKLFEDNEKVIYVDVYIEGWE
jgi:hypothetical protein